MTTPPIAAARPRSRLVAAFGVTAVVAGGVLLHAHDPTTTNIYPACPFRALTGALCPGCGTLRALHALLHGELHRAWSLNPFTVIMVPWMLWLAVSWLRVAITGTALTRSIVRLDPSARPTVGYGFVDLPAPCNQHGSVGLLASLGARLGPPGSIRTIDRVTRHGSRSGAWMRWRGGLILVALTVFTVVRNL